MHALDPLGDQEPPEGLLIPELSVLRLGQRLGVRRGDVDVARDSPAPEQASDLGVVPPRLPARPDVGVALLGELVDRSPQERVEHGQPAEGGGLDRVGADADHVERGMGLLERLRDHPDLGDRVVAALVREALQRPRADQDGEGLLEALAALDLGDAIALELDRAVAAPHADVEASPAQDIDHRELFGEPDRIVEGEDRGGQADPHAPGPHGGGGRQDRRRDGEAVLDEVVLGQPEAVEAELLGPRHLLDLAPEDFGVSERRWGLEEIVGSEAHLSPAGTLPQE